MNSLYPTLPLPYPPSPLPLPSLSSIPSPSLPPIYPSPPPPLPLPSGTEIEQIKKGYSENRPRSQLSHVASELQGVQRIMFDNIGAVLKRGEMIESESCILCGSLARQMFRFVRGRQRGAVITHGEYSLVCQTMSVGRVCTSACNNDVMWCACVCECTAVCSLTVWYVAPPPCRTSGGSVFSLSTCNGTVPVAYT